MTKQGITFNITKDSKMEILESIPKDYKDYGLSLLGANKMWKKGYKGDGIKIAVLDTGIDINHIEFKGKEIKGRDFTSGNYDNFRDVQGHGTHVAGIIGSPENGLGTVGIAPEAELYICKVLGDNGSGRLDWIVNAIYHCIAQRVDIINMSLGCPYMIEPNLMKALETAEAHGILLVAAAGNEGNNDGGYTNTIGIPAGYDETWAVGAIDMFERQASFSSEGEQLDVCVPGVDIISTYPENRYVRLSGTSMASPYFAGALALIIQQFKDNFGRKPNAQEVKDIVITNLKDLGPLGFDYRYGHGMFSFNNRAELEVEIKNI